MKYHRKLVWGVSITALAASFALSYVPAGASEVKQPSSHVGVATNVALSEAVANAQFLSPTGKKETLGALRGKTIFLFPNLTLCGDTCPFTTGNALRLQEDLTAHKMTNVVVVAIDVDPFRDRPARLRAYAKIIDSNFELWTEAGKTTTPGLTEKEKTSKNPVGTGDTNKNLTAIEKFLGWTVQVVPQDTPAPRDWMAPHERLTYDINHSDGFWIIDPRQHVRFVSGDQPAFTGKLSQVLATFMGSPSNIYKSPVYAGGWTPAEAFNAIEWADSLAK